MSDTEPAAITLPMIFTAVMDLREEVLEFVEQRDKEHAQELSGLLTAVGKLTKEIAESNEKSAKFIRIAEQCFDQLAVINSMANEIAVNVARHEAEIGLLKHPRPSVVPPHGGSSNGTDG